MMFNIQGLFAQWFSRLTAHYTYLGNVPKIPPSKLCFRPNESKSQGGGRDRGVWLSLLAPLGDLNGQRR